MQAALAAITSFLANPAVECATLDAALGRCANAGDVAWTICDFVGRRLALDDVVVYLTDADGQGLTQYAAWGAKRKAERVFENRIQLRIGQGIVGTCLLTGVWQNVPDTRIDVRYIADDEVRLSELAVAIHGGDRVLGVIDTETAHAYAFDTPHIEALIIIAQRAGARLAALL